MKTIWNNLELQLKVSKEEAYQEQERKSHWQVLQINATKNVIDMFVCLTIQYILIPMYLQTFLKFVIVKREEVLISSKLVSKCICEGQTRESPS